MNNVFVIVIFFSICSILNSNLYAQINQKDSIYEGSYKEKNKISLQNDDSEKKMEDKENPETESFLLRNRITGDWWGVRNIIEQNGLEVNFDYTGEVFSNRNGGLTRKTDYLHNINFTFNFDLQQMLSWSGAYMNVYFLGNKGGIPGEAVGTAQGISNIAAYDTWKLYEFWIQQNLFDDKFSLLAGLYDLNSEFDTRISSAIFINPSHGIGPDYSQSGLNGPSIFPTTSLTLRAMYQLTENTYLMGAIMDGVPGNPNNPIGTQVNLNKKDGALIAAELGVITNSSKFEQDYTKISIGGWYYTSDFEAIRQPSDLSKPAMIKGNYGLYVFAEKFLYAEKIKKEQGLAGFVRIGFADKNINQFAFYFGSGLTYQGLIENRDNDIIGIAIAYAKNGNPYVQNSTLEDINLDGYELNIELTYSAELFPWVVLQPDLQYVINPGTLTNTKNALVFGARIVFTF